jgi:hypothetical protein
VVKPHGGAVDPLAAPACGVEPTWLHIPSPTYHSLPLHTKTRFLSLKPEFLLFLLEISISFLSPSLLLRFGAFDLRYVTPPCIQTKFCLVKYFLSILLL